MQKLWGWKSDVNSTDPSNPPIQLPSSQIHSRFIIIWIWVFHTPLESYWQVLFEKNYDINKLSQNDISIAPVMLQSTKKSQTTYLAFKKSYLIYVLFKSNILNNLGKLDKIMEK